MKKVEFFNEPESIIKGEIVISDEYAERTFRFSPEEKKFDESLRSKDGTYFRDVTNEYKISLNPIEIEMRTIHEWDGPPGQDSIKDGVVLESELRKDYSDHPLRGVMESLSKENLDTLKKQVEWKKIPILGNYEVNLFILSKHPEIISEQEYRKFLRQNIEKIKIEILETKSETSNELSAYLEKLLN